MPIPRRRRFIIEPLDHEKRGSAGAPPILEGHVPARREMRDKDRRPAFDAREYFRIGCWREPARPQHRNAIDAIHLDLRRVAKVRADRRRERDETTRRKQRHAADQRWLIDCQTAGDPVAEGVSDQVRRTTAERLDDASDITGEIVQGRAIEGTATAADATHIYRDRLEPSDNQRARQLIKIAGATARIREQHDWCARTAKCAFQRRVTDVDASMLRQSRLPLCAAHGARLPCRAEDVSRDPASVPKLPKRGRTAPQNSAVRCSGKWPLSLAKTGLHPQKGVGPKQRQRVLSCPCRWTFRNATARAWREMRSMTGGSIPAFTLPVFTAVRSVRCAPPGPPMFRSSRRPRRPKRRGFVLACGAGLRSHRSAAHGSAAGRQLKERCGLSSRMARSMRRGLPSNASLSALV